MNDILQSGLLIIVGMLAGVINTLAGGGSLLTLPVLIFMGLPPNVANATNRIGIASVSYTHLRAHETDSYLVCRLLA